ncbi:MAG: hypothetical protein ACFFCW_12640 [Candidatus Hodarchaeota archaeon]
MTILINTRSTIKFILINALSGGCGGRWQKIYAHLTRNVNAYIEGSMKHAKRRGTELDYPK